MTPQAVESRRTALVIPIIPRCSAVAPSRVATLIGGFSQRDTDKWVCSQSCYSEKWRKAKDSLDLAIPLVLAVSTI